MGRTDLPHVFVDDPAELPEAEKWNTDFDHLNQTPSSLLPNGDFEAWTGGLPVGWTKVGATAVAAQDADSKRGLLAARLAVSAGTPGRYQFTVSAGVLKFLKGRKVRLWCWVKTSQALAGRLKVDDGVSVSASAYHAGDGIYRRLEVYHSVSPSATQLLIQLWAENDGAVLFDAAVCVDAESSLGYVPEVPDLSSPSAELTVGRINITGAATVPPTANQITKKSLVKAWALFDTAGNVLSEFNVLSVAKGGTGTYTVTFRTPMADTQYIVVGNFFETVLLNQTGSTPVTSMAVGSFGMQTRDRGGNLRDFQNVMILVFGNQ